MFGLGNPRRAAGFRYSPEIADWQYQHEPVEPALIAQDELMIRHTMWNYVGLIRNERRLNRALHILSELDLEIGRFYEPLPGKRFSHRSTQTGF